MNCHECQSDLKHLKLYGRNETCDYHVLSLESGLEINLASRHEILGSLGSAYTCWVEPIEWFGMLRGYSMILIDC